MKNEYFSILVVDGEEMSRQMLVQGLKSRGYTVSAEKDGEKALSAAAVESYDLIILDSALTKIDSFTVLEQLKSGDKTAHIPVVFLLPANDRKGEDRCAALGAKYSFYRPLQMPILLDMVQNLISRMEKSITTQKVKVARATKASYSVLIVDDEEMNRDLLSRRLVREGYLVASAASGTEALQKLTERAHDLVLLDIMMPQMDGYEVLRRIRSDQSLQRLPVIMLTAQHTLESVRQCKELGVNDYMMKPFNFVQLKNKIRASLGIVH